MAAKSERRLTSAKHAHTKARHKAVERIEREITRLLGKLNSARGQESRILLKAEIEHLRRLKARLIGVPPRRKPPEAGIAIPAVPPTDPLPKEGGAAAPLEFD